MGNPQVRLVHRSSCKFLNENSFVGCNSECRITSGPQILSVMRHLLAVPPCYWTAVRGGTCSPRWSGGWSTWHVRRGWGNRVRASGEEKKWRAIFRYILRGCWEEAKLFSDRTRGHRVEKREVPVRYNDKSFRHDDGRILEKVAQIVWGISTFGDIQNSAGEISEQFGVIRPDSSRGGWKKWSSDVTPT